MIAIEVRDEEEEATLECNAMGVFELTETMKAVKQPATMRLEGKLMGVGVQVLANSGASHNFIVSQVATTLGLPVEQNRTLGVRLGDGHKVTTEGMCRN